MCLYLIKPYKISNMSIIIIIWPMRTILIKYIYLFKNTLFLTVHSPVKNKQAERSMHEVQIVQIVWEAASA